MKMPYSVGNRIWFAEDKLPYKVQAANKRYVICTRKLNKRQDAQLLWNEVERHAFYHFMEAYNSLKKDPVYTIIDLQENIRGTENLIFCMGFGTIKRCKEALQRLNKAESEISHRNRVDLIITKVSKK